MFNRCLHVETVVALSLKTIKDTGCGMSEETISKIFQKYYRLEKSKTTGGLGLGLALCKSIVDIMGGTIKCESVINKGTTFVVTLPTGIETPNEKQENIE